MHRLPFLLPDSPGDKLLRHAHGAKIELLRFQDDDGASECHVQFEISGTIETAADARQLLGALLAEFDAEKGGGHHV